MQFSRALCVLAVLMLSACSDGDSSGVSDAGSTPDKTNPDNTNTAPTAVAGADQNVSVGSRVELSGTESTDPDGDMLTYAWTFESKPSGSAAELEDADTPTPSFVADTDGEYVVGLGVDDGQISSESATVKATAATANSKPVANAGADQNVATGNSVALDGSASSDADGDELSYSWQFSSRPSGSAATLTKASAVSPTFVADVDGEYVVELTVNDGAIDSESDSVTITAKTANSAPTADAGADQSVVAGSTVTLDGSSSGDANGDALSYAWRFVSVPKSSDAELVDANTVSPSFVADEAGDYVAELVVNDGSADSTADRVTVSAAQANARPVADAGSDQNVNTGAVVTLDGTASSDADGDQISYDWSFVSRPAGSSAAFDDAASPQPSFTADVDGDYVVQLVVDDGEATSAPARATVTATTANSAPAADAGPDQNVDTGVKVTLDGSASTDADGDALSYHWSFVSIPGSSTTSLTNTTSATPAFTPDVDGTYIVELIVNDGAVDSAADRVKVIATTANSAPMADAGPDQSVTTAEVVTLDGSASSDNDGDALTYQWSFVSKPSGSSASLGDATTASPSFTADQAGSYVVGLIVNDGMVDSAADRVTVIAAAPDLKGVPTRGSASSIVNSLPPQAEYVLNDSPFTLTAKGADFTIQNLRAVDRNGVVTPRFEGLSDGMVIKAGQTVTFNLVSPRTNGQTADLLFEFSEDRNGEQFRYTWSFQSN